MEATTRKPKFYNPFSWNWAVAGEIAREYTDTTFVFVFIANGLATFLLLFTKVNSNELFRHIVGAIAFAYSVVALLMFINMGVKHQLKAKKKARK